MNEERPIMPKAQSVYGECVYYLTIVTCLICIIGPVLAMISPENNVINPYFLFAEIFEGRTAFDVWAMVGAGDIQGGHFYMQHFFTGDGFTQFGLALGCSSTAWSLLVAAAVYAQERIYIYSGMAVFVALLIFFSASGFIGG